ncbi:hypothetical protein TWF192_007954 [Orbilia oligospora]|uniref:Uncharacterized protein n=1 Tax=Orbilia oligospora TaxID=2813651 RepID=A0A6G1M4Z5_ORBOL|nr:hypothetical protein TWF191_003010 [Orbilia oligospora]KAF3243888.1 hypothetical protein TWF192_007954 [Orbilia oligospora]
MPFGHHRSHSRQDRDNSSQGPEQLHTSGALLQAAQTLSSIGKPSTYHPAAPGPNIVPQQQQQQQQQQLQIQQHQHQQAQLHYQQQHPTSPPQPPSGAPSAQSPMSYHQNPQLNPGGYGGYGGNYSSTSPHPGSAMQGQPPYNDPQQQQQQDFQRQNSFRTHEGHGPPPPSLQPQQYSQRAPPQPQYNEYASPIHIHQPQQPPPPQQQQGYQAYPGGSGGGGGGGAGVSRSHTTSTNLSRSNTLAGAHPPAGEPDANALYGDANTKYLPITHMQSSSASNLPDPSQSSNYRKYAPSGSMGGQDLGISGGFGLDVQSRQGSITEAPPKELQKGSHYYTQWPSYAIDWCKWPIYGSPGASGYAGQSGVGRIALGSYSEDGHNYISILNTANKVVNTDSHPRGESTLEITKFAEATLTYPITRILWEPPTQSKPLTDLIATAGDHLRLWSLPNAAPAAISTPTSSITSRSNQSSSDLPTKKLSQLALLSNSKSTDFTAPLTSLDWNPISPSLIITSSIDTTCTIWDIPSLTAKTQLIAHDKEVFDVRFMSGSVDVFASCGADGSVRMFDLRSLDHSTIIYEPTVKADGGVTPSPGGVNPIGGTGGVGSTLQGPPPLLKLAASPHEGHLLATFADQSNIIRILDVRQPGQALVELRGAGGNINCIDWCPYRRGMIAGGTDDSLVLIWDMMNDGSVGNPHRQTRDERHGHNQEPTWRTPVAHWKSEYEVNNLSWAPSLGNGMALMGGEPGKNAGEWIGCCGGKGVYGVKF